MGIWARMTGRPQARALAPSGTMVASLGFGIGPTTRRGTREIFAAYRTHPWLFAISNRLAHERATAARRNLVAWDGPEDDLSRSQIGRDDPRYEIMRLLRRPLRVATGQIMTARARLKALALWYGLAGEAYIAKIRSEQTGRVVGLAPVSPLWVLSTPTEASPHYVVQVDGASAPRQVSPADMIPIVDPDAENPYGRGIGVGATLGDELDTDEGAAQMGRAVLANFGSPSGLVVVEGVEKDELPRLKASWQERFSGPARAGQIEFARGKATFVPISSSIKDSQLIEVRRFLRDTFAQAHGISPEIIGILDGSTRDSTYVAYYHLALGALVPWLEVLSDALQAHLVPEFGDDPESLCVGYTSPIPEDRELQLRCLATAPGAFRGADARRVGGFAPDAELGAQPLGRDPQIATPTQLPRGPGASVREPAFVAALTPTRPADEPVAHG